MSGFRVIPCDFISKDCAYEDHYHLEGAPAGKVIRAKDISDGYHTFGELYEHRMALTLALVRQLAGASWRSMQHHPTDGPMFEDSFIVGIDLPTGTITYHYNVRYWTLFNGMTTLENAPRWDGAAPVDTVTRLLQQYQAPAGGSNG